MEDFIDKGVTIDGDKRRLLEGAWVNGDGFELPCKYYIYAAKMDKETIAKNCKRRKEFNKLYTIHAFSVPLSEMGLYTGKLIQGWSYKSIVEKEQEKRVGLYTNRLTNGMLIHDIGPLIISCKKDGIS